MCSHKGEAEKIEDITGDQSFIEAVRHAAAVRLRRHREGVEERKSSSGRKIKT